MLMLNGLTCTLYGHHLTFYVHFSWPNKYRAHIYLATTLYVPLSIKPLKIPLFTWVQNLRLFSSQALTNNLVSRTLKAICSLSAHCAIFAFGFRYLVTLFSKSFLMNHSDKVETRTYNSCLGLKDSLGSYYFYSGLSEMQVLNFCLYGIGWSVYILKH